jgi:histidine triad (HIT) family protein
VSGVDPNCVFCAIAHGSGDASLLHEDDSVIAFMDIRPVYDGHLLVVPRQHSMLLNEVEPHTLTRVWEVVTLLNSALRESGLPCDGVNVFVADGEAAGQEVPHVHVHLIPRTVGDRFGFKFPPGYGREPSRERLDEQAAMIRAAL